jgi:hypothetical protein
MSTDLLLLRNGRPSNPRNVNGFVNALNGSRGSRRNRKNGSGLTGKGSARFRPKSGRNCGSDGDRSLRNRRPSSDSVFLRPIPICVPDCRNAGTTPHRNSANACLTGGNEECRKSEGREYSHNDLEMPRHLCFAVCTVVETGFAKKPNESVVKVFKQK